MKRTLVVSDIHGYRLLLKRLLEVGGYDPGSDQLVMLGDYIDRGPDSRGTVDYVRELMADGAIVLSGNHEHQLLQAYDTLGCQECSLFFNYGGRECLKSYGLTPEAGSFRSLPVEHIEFMRTLPYYHETGEHIFVHGGLDPTGRSPRLADKLDLFYAREVWLANPYQGRKAVIFGHTPTHHIPGHPREEFWFEGNRVGIDLGVYETGCLGMLELPGYKVYKVRL
ncbi:MAG: serine/threonine protein phosphatase [Firmicutes bacterium]|nr:serine/threonine protein phosphatase [Bacillota bacterium]